MLYRGRHAKFIRRDISKQRIAVKKIVDINPLVKKIFARKCYEDGLKAGSLEKYVAGFQQDQNRKPQDIFFCHVFLCPTF
jgi:hypothetical protein